MCQDINICCFLSCLVDLMIRLFAFSVIYCKKLVTQTFWTRSDHHSKFYTDKRVSCTFEYICMYCYITDLKGLVN